MIARLGCDTGGRSVIPPVANLKTALSLALDDDLAVLRAQFDLSNVTASSIDLLRDQRRALQAAACPARRNVAASVDANCRRSGIEVRLKHTRAAQTVTLRSWRAAVKRTTMAAEGALTYG